MKFSAAFLEMYEILDVVGTGGTSTVYRVRQRSLDRMVALKLITGFQPNLAARFQREVQVLATLEHPGILRIFDWGVEDEHLFLVCELLEGRDLRDLMSSRTIPREEAIDILTQVGEALDHAHQRGIIHRDVKPENVFLAGGNRLKLGDFGLARFVEPGHTVTQEGVILGTPAYVSPEQVLGLELTPASDQYSFGILAYELLSGRRPFGGRNLADCMRKRLDSPPPSLFTLVEGIPSGIDDAILRCLQREPRDRFENLLEVIEVLKRPQAARRKEHPALPAHGAPAVASRTRTVALGGAFLGLVLVGMFIGIHLPGTGSAPPATVSASIAPPEEGDFLRRLDRVRRLFEDSIKGQKLLDMRSRNFPTEYVRQRMEPWRISVCARAFDEIGATLDAHLKDHHDLRKWMLIEELFAMHVPDWTTPFRKVHEVQVEVEDLPANFEEIRTRYVMILVTIREKLRDTLVPSADTPPAIEALHAGMLAWLEHDSWILQQSVDRRPDIALLQGGGGMDLVRQANERDASRERARDRLVRNLTWSARTLIESDAWMVDAPRTASCAHRWLMTARDKESTRSLPLVRSACHQLGEKLVEHRLRLPMNDYRVLRALVVALCRSNDMGHPDVRREATRQGLALPEPQRVAEIALEIKQILEETKVSRAQVIHEGDLPCDVDLDLPP